MLGLIENKELPPSLTSVMEYDIVRKLGVVSASVAVTVTRVCAAWLKLPYVPSGMEVLYAPAGKTGGLSLASVIWTAKVKVELSWGEKVSRTITFNV